ncbi:uncharacterized protein C1orf167 homolog [Eublepharis macularius]|uniref:Uncharacterized protein C1orf167 homolog n=1 Tax=Eublepharis macularius TaxID=481883 RepID=A0AA97KKJ8_EUBMA|nr:uncharacterized protein C1orf167 homolog [Eublepharis macularius]
MENPNKVTRGRRKENVPPRLSSNTTPEQRNVQKNINVNLFSDSFSCAAVSRHRSGPPIPSRAASHGKSRVASVQGAKPTGRVLVQTNLSCPHQPLWHSPSGFSGGSSQQQSNLENKLRCCRWENAACVGDPPWHSAVDLGPNCSCLDPVGLKRGPKNDFSGRSQTPRDGLRLSSNDVSKGRTGNKDQHVLKQPRGGFSLLETTRGTAGDCFCPPELSERSSASSFLHDPRLCPVSPSRSSSSSPPGPALTLEHLSSSTSIGSHPTTATLQVLLCSSQVSADLHGSIQQLKKEAASMGAHGSFPWESKPFPRPHPSHVDPRVSGSGRLCAAEQLAREDSCARQASMKWRTSFAREWGLGSTPGALEYAEPHPAGYKCKNAGLYTHPVEASDQLRLPAFCNGVGSASWVCQGEESCSNPSFCYHRCCSGTQQVLERKGTSCPLKTHYHQKTRDPEELSSRFFHCSEVEHGDTPLGLPSFDGLEVPLETLHVRPPVNPGVTMYGTQSEGHLTYCSPEVGQFGKGSEYVDMCQLQDEPGGADGDPPTMRVLDEDALPLPAHNSLEEIAGKSFGEHSSAAMDGKGPTVFGGSAPGSKNFSTRDCWPDAEQGHGEELPAEKNAESSTLPRCEESRHGVDAVRKEALGRNNESMAGGKNRDSPRSTLLLAKCFAAWRNRVFGRRAAAQALYERQLLRKGLGALKWAVELRDVQVGIAQRRHNLTLLATSFCKWQRAMEKKRKEQASCTEMETHGRDFPTSLLGEKIAKGPIFRQLPAECLEAATQYSKAEGNLWLQIHHNQGVDKLCRTAQAVRDMRRLAAAFRLWRLQKEHLDKEQSRAQEACALLEKKRLRNVFRTWQSCCRATKRILPLMAQIQRRLVSRCFNTWKGFAEREACARCCRDRQRVGALRLCFQQWALMVQVREQARKTLRELLALRRRTAYERFGFAVNAPKTQPHLNTVRESQRNGPDTLDGLFVALVLQKMFYVWKTRWQQQQQADAVRRALERRQLRRALGHWRWKALSRTPLRRCPRDLAEDPFLASLDSDEFSQSSGFHSNTPALPVSSDSLDRESSLMDSSPGSFSSLVTITDSRQLPHLVSSPTPSLGWEDLGQEAVEPCIQNQNIGKEDFVRGPFQSWGVLGPDCEVHSITVSSSWESERSGGDEKDLFENQRQLLERCFACWSSQTLQNLKGKEFRRRTLLSWAFISWTVATARSSVQRKAQVWLESTRQQHLLASCFGKWKDEVLRTKQQKEEKNLPRSPAGCKTTWRWRKAVRGCQALRLNAGTTVQQSGSYWTKAAAMSLCLRQRSSLVGASKFMKISLSWPSQRRRSREEGLPSSLAVCARLNGSSFHVWLMLYRWQNRTAGPSQQGPLESPGRTEGRRKPVQIQDSSAETDSTRWLWRKYLRLWRRNVLLRRFQDARRMRLLVRAWLLWKDACRTEWVIQALAWQRLAQWGWKAWRRRCLQAWVAEHFLEAQNRSLLNRAFGRWRHLAAKANDQPQGSFEISKPVSHNKVADLTRA